QQLSMVARGTQEDLRALCPFEPQMSVVVPGEPDPAMNLNTLCRRMQVSLRGRGFGQRSECVPLRVIDRGRLRRIVSCGLGKLHLEQQVGQFVLDGLE